MKLPAFLAFLLLAAVSGWWLRRVVDSPDGTRPTPVAPTPAASAPNPSAPNAAANASPVSASSPVTDSLPPVSSAPPSNAVIASPAVASAEILRQLLLSGDALSRDRAFREILPALLAHDALAAVSFVETWPPGPVRDDLFRELAHHWTRLDPTAALAWLSTLSAAERALATPSALAQVRQTDVGGALEAAQVFRSGLDDGSAEHHIQLWTEENPAAVVSWIRTQPPGDLRDRLAARAILTRAQRDPHEGIALLELLSPAARNPTRDELLRQWQQHDPAAVAAWRAENSPR